MASTAAVLNILVKANTSSAVSGLRKVDRQARVTEKTFRDVNGRLRDTRGRFVGLGQETAKTGTQLSKATKHASRHGKALKEVGHGAAYALGAGGFGGGLYAVFEILHRSIDKWHEAEQVTKLTGAALKSTGGAANVTAKHVEELSKRIEQKTAIDHLAIQTSENLLLTFPKIRNEAGKNNKIFDRATVAVTNLATALNHGAAPSVDQLHSASIQLGKALQDPIKGATALRRVGVDLDASQRKQIKTLVEHGHRLDAQKIILRELSTEFGKAAEKTATPSRRLQTNLNDLTETLGKGITPWLNKATGQLNKFIEQMQTGTGRGGRFVKTLQGIWNAVKPTVTVLGRLVAGLAQFAASHTGLAKVAVEIGVIWALMRKMRGFSLAETLLGGSGGGTLGGRVKGRFAGLGAQMRSVGKGILGASLMAGIFEAVTASHMNFGERLQKGVSVATLGIFPAPREIDQRMRTIVQRIQTWRGRALAINRKGDPGASIIRKKDIHDFDAGQLHMIRGMAQLRNAANRTLGPGAKLRTGAWLNPGPVIKDLNTIHHGFGVLRRNTAVSMTQINRVVDQNARAIRHSLGVNTQAGRAAAEKNMRLAARAITDSLHHGWVSADQFLKSIRHSFAVNSRGSARVAKANFDTAARAIHDAVSSGQVSADRGLREINRLFRSYLGRFGLHGAAATFYLRSGARGTGFLPGHSGLHPGRNQRGGYISEGAPSGDTVPSLLEKGEGVINRRAVEALGGPEAIHAINRRYPRFQTGGVIPRQMVGGPNVAERAMDQRALDTTRHRANAILTEARRRAQASAVGGEILGKGSLRMYAFPLPQFGSEGRVDRGQDMEASRPHATTVAVGHGKVVNAGIGFPGIQIRLSRGPLKGNTAFYGHNNAVFTKVGANVRPGQPVGQTGNPIGGGGPTHTEIGFMQGYGSQSGHWVGPGSAGGMLMHNLLHRIAPGRIGAAARMARGGIAGGLLTGLNRRFPRHGIGGASGHYQMDSRQVRAVAEAAGFSPARALQFDQIARGESTRYPGVVSGDGGWGLWQITPSAWPANGSDMRHMRALGGLGAMLNPIRNAKMARFMFGESGLRPWHGTAYLQPLHRHVRSVLGSRRTAAEKKKLPPARSVRGLKKRLKKISHYGGLSKSMAARLKDLQAQADAFAEWADRAQTLTFDDDSGQTHRGTVFGHDEAWWLDFRLQRLWSLRNYLIKAHRVLIAARKRIQKVLLPRARKHLKMLRKHPVVNRDRIKAYRDKIIPALRKRYGDIGSTDTDLLSTLSDVQGAGSSMKMPGAGLLSMPPIGVLGGSIFDTQVRLRELGRKTTATDTATPERLQSIIDLLREQLQQANLGKAVSEGAFQVFRDMPSFQTLPGQWHTVPGPTNQPVAAVVHGGEHIGRPGPAQLVIQQLTVHEDGRVTVRYDDREFEAKVDRVLRKKGSRVGRTPGRPGT